MSGSEIPLPDEDRRVAVYLHHGSDRLYGIPVVVGTWLGFDEELRPGSVGPLVAHSMGSQVWIDRDGEEFHREVRHDPDRERSLSQRGARRKSNGYIHAPSSRGHQKMVHQVQLMATGHGIQVIPEHRLSRGSSKTRSVQECFR